MYIYILCHVLILWHTMYISYIKLKYMYIVYIYQYLYIIYAYNTMFYKYYYTIR